jgi:hypothetical protein
MHSVADLIPGKAMSSTSVPTDCPRGQRSTAVEFSAAALMTTNGMADGLEPAGISADLPVFDQSPLAAGLLVNFAATGSWGLQGASGAA